VKVNEPQLLAYTVLKLPQIPSDMQATVCLPSVYLTRKHDTK
jgi:hypothetical protein